MEHTREPRGVTHFLIAYKIYQYHMQEKHNEMKIIIEKGDHLEEMNIENACMKLSNRGAEFGRRK